MEESLYQIRYNTRDRLLRAWEETMELVRSFETWSREMDDQEYKRLFGRLAEDEALHAAELFEHLKKIDD